MNKPLITIFTPAFNRAYTLHRVYDSLCGQENKDFIWLIVDDGSTDNTAELVNLWQKQENGFEIRYIYKKNGGMHTAHNTAYCNIDTELNICIDSDDALAPDAIQIIYDEWEKVYNKDYAGLVGLDASFDNKIIGNAFHEDLYETTLSGYYQKGGSGDKKIVLRTDVVREYPSYPTFENEKFVPLGTLYTMIDQDYKLRVVNKVLCLVEYMEDGSTRNIYRQYFNNPNGFRYGRLVSLSIEQSFKRKCIIYIHYIAESILAKKKSSVDAPSKALATILWPLGKVLSIYIKYKVKG